ncbi:hypothetical protein N9H95_03235 [Gammaproteobacteria bacterium]|nr:hypothetical protein [Gammaproteobacteria bacterium]
MNIAVWLWVVFLIWSGVLTILNIILFFKVWGMTNDIKFLTNSYIHEKGITTERKNYEDYYVDKDGKRIEFIR